MENELKNETPTCKLTFGDSIIWLEKARNANILLDKCFEAPSSLAEMRMFLMKVEVALLDGEVSVEIKPGEMLKACDEVTGSRAAIPLEEMINNMFHRVVIGDIERSLFA